MARSRNDRVYRRNSIARLGGQCLGVPHDIRRTAGIDPNVPVGGRAACSRFGVSDLVCFRSKPLPRSELISFAGSYSYRPKFTHCPTRYHGSPKTLGAAGKGAAFFAAATAARSNVASPEDLAIRTSVNRPSDRMIIARRTRPVPRARFGNRWCWAILFWMAAAHAA